jgi:hypothetical protein
MAYDEQLHVGYVKVDIYTSFKNKVRAICRNAFNLIKVCIIAVFEEKHLNSYFDQDQNNHV